MTTLPPSTLSSAAASAGGLSVQPAKASAAEAIGQGFDAFLKQVLDFAPENTAQATGSVSPEEADIIASVPASGLTKAAIDTATRAVEIAGTGNSLPPLNTEPNAGLSNEAKPAEIADGDALAMNILPEVSKTALTLAPAELPATSEDSLSADVPDQDRAPLVAEPTSTEQTAAVVALVAGTVLPAEPTAVSHAKADAQAVSGATTQRAVELPVAPSNGDMAREGKRDSEGRSNTAADQRAQLAVNLRAATQASDATNNVQQPTFVSAATTAALSSSAPEGVIAPVTVVAQSPTAPLAAPPSPASPLDIAAIVNRIVAAQHSASSDAAQVTLQHEDFGRISLNFARSAEGLDVEVQASDSEAQRAIAAAIAVDRPHLRFAENLPNTTQNIGHGPLTGGESDTAGTRGQRSDPNGQNARDDRTSPAGASNTSSSQSAPHTSHERGIFA